MDISVGDTVTVSANNHIRGALGSQFDATVLGLPTQQFPYWKFETATHVLYMQNVTVSKLKP